MSTINIDELSKVELRVATVITAEKVPDTDKLLRLEVDLGDEKRQIVAGLALSYPETDKLIGKQIIIVANLEPRVLRGLESKGMVLAATGESGPVVLTVDGEVPAGVGVR